MSVDMDYGYVVTIGIEKPGFVGVLGKKIGFDGVDFLFLFVCRLYLIGCWWKWMSCLSLYLRIGE